MRILQFYGDFVYEDDTQIDDDNSVSIYVDIGKCNVVDMWCLENECGDLGTYKESAVDGRAAQRTGACTLQSSQEP